MTLVMCLALVAAPERLVVGVDGPDLWSRLGDARAKELVQLARGVEVRRLSKAVVVDVLDAGAAVAALAARGDVRFIERDVPFPVRLRAVPDDTFYGEQWHLFGAAGGNHLGAEAAWDVTRGERAGGGGAVRVAVVDDGFDLTHPDLEVADGWDVSGAVPDDDPSVDSGDWHGMQTAGVVAARGFNARGVTGVCPACELLGVRLIGDGGPDDLFTTGSAAAAAIEWAIDAGADVINNSWGPPDGNQLDPEHPVTLWPRATPDRPAGLLPQVLADALTRAVTEGRGGLGVIVTWSSGNGNELVTYDRFASDPRVCAFGSLDETGARAFYSDWGPTLFAVTPSSGGNGMRKIVTTDVTGPGGVDAGDYSRGFGGTSASSAMGAGVAALVIAAFPSLTAAQVQESLALGAALVDPEGGAWRGGRSPYYGFGRLDAAGALAQAALYADGCTFGHELCMNGLDDDCNGVADDPGRCALCIPDRSLEICDEIDNDCDGCNNEDFVCFDTDRPDCAPCRDTTDCRIGARCRSSPDFPGAWCFAECGAGCPDGFSCDGEVCLLTPTAEAPDCRRWRDDPCRAPEVCNGEDDDEDGEVDEVAPRGREAELATERCSGPGVCAERVAVCYAGRWLCADPDGYESVERSLEDGLDNDCDGVTDEERGCSGAGSLPAFVLGAGLLVWRRRRAPAATAQG